MGTRRLLRPARTDRWGPLPPHGDRPRYLGPRRMRRHLRWLERLLLVIGILSLGYYAYVSAEAALYQAFEDRELDAILASGPVAPDPRATILPVLPARAPLRERPARGAAIGRIEIPRLGVSAIIRAGSDARTLRLAVGYIPGTALPGERGNTGLAAHRDTFFRRLRDIRTDDEIRIVTKEGTYRYDVDSTRIVQPKDVWVLNPTPEPALTLVTCYPFNYIGSAPERFIVRAELSR